MPNISRSMKMKFGQLIEHNMRNILQMSWRNQSQTLFWKIKIEYISGTTVGNVIQFIFIACPCRGLPKSIETKVLTTCFYVKALYKAFLKSKKKSGTRHLIFCMIFEEECFWWNLLSDCFYFLRYWEICVL